jgi:drug/metabolite transporter (DMT)-like permease
VLGRGSAAAQAPAGFTLGVALLIASTLMNVFNGLLSRRLVEDAHPFCVSTVGSATSVLMYGAAALLWGDVTEVSRAPAPTVAILIFSGVYGLLIGGGLYTVMMKQTGLVVAQFIGLVVPVFTGIFGFFLLGETLSPLQIAFGAVLIVGCGLVLYQRQRNRRMANVETRRAASPGVKIQS